MIIRLTVLFTEENLGPTSWELKLGEMNYYFSVYRGIYLTQTIMAQENPEDIDTSLEPLKR